MAAMCRVFPLDCIEVFAERKHVFPPAEITVVVDAGHGGSDTGAVSPHGRFEKDANLRLALAVRDELVARGYRVVMTRTDDSFPALYDRPKVAHRVHGRRHRRGLLLLDGRN